MVTTLQTKKIFILNWMQEKKRSNLHYRGHSKVKELVALDTFEGSRVKMGLERRLTESQAAVRISVPHPQSMYLSNYSLLHCSSFKFF